MFKTLKTNLSIANLNTTKSFTLKTKSTVAKVTALKSSSKITTHCNHLLWSLKYATLIIFIIISSFNVIVTKAEGQLSVEDDFSRILGRCKMTKTDFDDCMKDVLNDMRAYFPTGVPSYNIRPFDPHRSSFVELRRGDQNGFGGFKLILRNASEYGWTSSKVTKFRADVENKRIIYSQYFPEKSLDGYYEFSGKILGTPVKRKGLWNMTLYDYSQTTSVRRLGDPGALLKVHIEVDRIGGLKMHVSDFLAVGRQQLDNFADGVINSMWPIGFPFIKPIINELVSTAFTDIFNESFRYFPLHNFLT